MSKYDHLIHDELARLLEARDRRNATRFGLVWEANEIERDNALNADFVALDLQPEVCAGTALYRNLIIESDNFDAMKRRIPVEKRTLDVFSHTIQQEFNFAADLSPDQAARLASAVLQRSKVFDCRELRKALIRKMQIVMREEALDGADDIERVASFLDVVLASNPDLLYEAQKQALAQAAAIHETEDLPDEIVSDEPLAASTRNVYGVIPDGLNTRERAFVDLLDRDPNGIVMWWHRNEPHKPWSVNVLMPDGRGFFPDFVVGIDGRKTEDGVLLADPKLNFQRDDEVQKLLAEHRYYGSVLILCRDGTGRWMTVEYDEKNHRPRAVREFRISDAVGF